MQEIKLINTPSQTFTIKLGKSRVDVAVKYNSLSDRWVVDLSIDGVLKLSGRKIINDVDLLRPYGDINIGVLFAIDTTNTAKQPDRDNIPSGIVRIFSTTKEELESVAQS